MSNLTIAKLEKLLAIKLPQTYVDTFQRFSKLEGSDDDLYGMIADLDQLLKVNLECRKTPKSFVRSPGHLAKAWPNNYFIFAKRASTCFIDIDKKNPEVHSIRDRKLEEKGSSTPSYHKNVRAFAKHSTDSIKVRQFYIKKALVEKKERELAKLRKGKPVACPNLVEEGWKLAKSAVLIGRQGTKLVGIGGGDGVIEPPKKAMEHVLTVACSAIPDNPNERTGLISIYRVDDDGMYKAIHTPDGRLPRESNGTKLYATNYDCLPPFGVLTNKGSAQVKAWFRSLGIPGRDAEIWTYNNASAHPEVSRYLKEFSDNHPFFVYPRKKYWAMLGGWTFNYPSGSEWYSIMNKPLLISTLQGEPWLELVNTGQTMKLHVRVT